MPQLAVHLLGGFRVELDGETIYGFESDKGRALLAFLMTEADRPHRRETLAGLLWPDRPDTVARASLRQALSCVRRVLGDHRPSNPAPPPFLFVTPTDVQFNTHSAYALDVAELEALARSPTRCQEVLPAELCSDLLAGFAVPDSEVFQTWLLNKQEYYHRLALDILEEQSTDFERRGDYTRAVAAARLQLQMEPWLEEAHRSYMRALALTGRRDEALRQYDICSRVLQAELGVQPAASTQALHAAILSGELLASNPTFNRQAVTGHLRASTSYPPSAQPPLVARAQELDRLSNYLADARAGQTCFAFISGEAGSGKTALLEAFASTAMAQYPDLLVATARCSPGGAVDPLAPLRRLAEVLFGDLDNPVAWWLRDAAQLARLRGATGPLLAALSEHGLGLVGPLVPVASVLRRARALGPGAIDPHTRQPWWKTLPDRTPATLAQGVLLDQLLVTLAAIARQQPLLLLLDDLHWVDDASADFLRRLGRELEHSRLLTLMAYRSATVALGRPDPHTGQLSGHPLAAVTGELRLLRGDILVELDNSDGRAFVEALVDTEPNRLGARFRDALYAQTGGHALFTVELLRDLQERGEVFKDEAGRWMARASLDWGALPARVEAAIGERIGRLPARCRSILSCASVQGDSFSGETVAGLLDAPSRDVIDCLSGPLSRQHLLVRPEGLRRSGAGQDAMYRFRHHLYQKYLYEQLDPVERARWHEAVAAGLSRQYAGDAEERERLGLQLAWHYESAGLPLQAARALSDAGHHAMRMSAFREALARFDHALDLLAAVPQSEERTQVAQLLEVARLGPQRCLSGIASAEQADAIERATGARAGRAYGRSGLLLLATGMERRMANGAFEESLAEAARLRSEATEAGEEDLVGLAICHCGINEHYLGRLQASEQHFAVEWTWLTPVRRAQLVSTLGVDVEALGLAISALNLWLLGYPEQALARSRQAMASARMAGALLGQACSAGFGATLLYLVRGDDRAMMELMEQCYRLSIEHGLGLWQVFADVCLGRVMFLQGDEAAGIRRMWGDGYRGGNMAIGTDFFMVMLAESCLQAAERAASAAERIRLAETGLRGLDNMLGPSPVPCGQVYKAELRRLQGELLLVRDGLAAAGEALACFRCALELGQEQAALAWQLRAATSLVRLHDRLDSDHQPELADARRTLAAIYAQYTEGHHLPDLREAAAILGVASRP